MSLAGELKNLIHRICTEGNSKEHAECVGIAARFLTQRTEWRQICRAERTQDQRTLEHFAAHGSDEYIRTRAAEFIHNVKKGRLHIHKDGVLRFPAPSEVAEVEINA
jgi:hypothetical protein